MYSWIELDRFWSSWSVSSRGVVDEALQPVEAAANVGMAQK
jgi:hypothetical protein